MGIENLSIVILHIALNSSYRIGWHRVLRGRLRAMGGGDFFHHLLYGDSSCL